MKKVFTNSADVIHLFAQRSQNEAIRLLKEHLIFMYKKRGKKFDCIINAMGSTAFYKNHEPLWEHEQEELIGYAELREFLDEWNEWFHLTGYPIKIDKNGIKVENEFD